MLAIIRIISFSLAIHKNTVSKHNPQFMVVQGDKVKLKTYRDELFIIF